MEVHVPRLQVPVPHPGKCQVPATTVLLASLRHARSGPFVSSSSTAFISLHLQTLAMYILRMLTEHFGILRQSDAEMNHFALSYQAARASPPSMQQRCTLVVFRACLAPQITPCAALGLAIHTVLPVRSVRLVHLLCVIYSLIASG